MKTAFKDPANGDAVVYWMRMQDMRVDDNRALSQASKQAVHEGVPLITLFIISPQDYQAHDRSPRRIDFVLRNLWIIKERLAELHIPLYIVTHVPRRTLSDFVILLLMSWRATRLYANIEHEVDELRRDVRISDLAADKKIRCLWVHDKLVIEPGILATKGGKTYTVYSPFQRSWIALLNSDLSRISEVPSPAMNSPEIHDHPVYAKLFSATVPDSVPGFCLSKEESQKMDEVWPAGTAHARKILHRFLYTRTRRAQLGVVDPLSAGEEVDVKLSRASLYKDQRDKGDRDSTSRLSPYLATGVISARECIRETMKLLGIKKVEASRDKSIGVWVQEIAWRDFYTHVLAAFPRVSMGRPFNEKYADVRWETNEEHLQAWKEGRTGVPIVDAAMRQCRTMGWMHNRMRMIAAMYLTKDLMIDWRLGEKYFMENFIDGDLASNNGGWQWSASTGTDAVPYFRIFNPYSQSEKADPDGHYIRYFVPELQTLKGAGIHNPAPEVADRLGYPRPLIRHDEARERALRRYKNPGES
ncbi:hypothetical protein PUNSTDRAFT_119399 [Punctularia strigosozonata HHB-11173 SS5]|uniref:uncharacterized protein n=1 Tax=Punctularia strigosozonata (strain HHB-11173) TaxID=741275 RepID=UPI000441803E|nr:uncharacterized protein PUNSTDRAFT_119399 [Punctularia strigosozonata HHB-11173 SS5]EIN10414.1 hypothetical protein PUNSTDRAFT_119399 [Punctularia strigosozonata HHB-11173 SS5]